MQLSNFIFEQKFKNRKIHIMLNFFLELQCLSTSIYLKTKRENLIRFQFGFQFLSNFVPHIPSKIFILFFVPSELFNAKYEVSNINES